MRRSNSSSPACTGRWSCSHTEGIAHRSKQLCHRVARVRGEEAQAPQPGDGVDRGEKLGQPCPGTRVAVAVDVLAEQGDLAHAAVDEATDVGDDLRCGAAALAAAHEGHDAVGTHLVAPTHHRHVGEQPVRGRHGHGPVDVAAVERLQAREETLGLAHVKHVVEVGHAFEQRRAVLDSHAAGQRDRPPGALPLPRISSLNFPYTFCSALERTAQLISTAMSASSSGTSGMNPISANDSARRSWSASFIWQPMCHRWNPRRLAEARHDGLASPAQVPLPSPPAGQAEALECDAEGLRDGRYTPHLA